LIAAAKNVTFPVIIEISTFQDGTINVTSSTKSFNSDHEKESAVHLPEKLNEERKLSWEDKAWNLLNKPTNGTT
jgi:hypothetical protein